MNLRWIPQLLFILGFLKLGDGIASFFDIPLPGSVIGMILLFGFLLTGIMKLSWIEKAASFQLKHLTLLFIPPTVSLILSPSLKKILSLSILLILLVSSVCSLLGTAICVECFEKIKRRNAK